MKKAKVVNCKELSLQTDVTDPELLDTVAAEIPAGDIIEVDDSQIVWSWDDRQYYLTRDGYYARVECLEMMT